MVTVVAQEDSPGALVHPIVLVDGHPVATSDGLVAVLKARVSADPTSTVVQVRADRRLPYSDVSPVIKACRDAGLTTLRLVTERVGGGT